jgi:hypothetical protein
MCIEKILIITKGSEIVVAGNLAKIEEKQAEKKRCIHLFINERMNLWSATNSRSIFLS